MKNSGYKIAIFILLAVVFGQWAYMARTKPPKKALKAPEVKIKGRIAIVIDDWGYNLNNAATVKQIKYPLTAAVLPNLVYSSEVAAQLNQHGLQVILHLPMEPREKFRLEKNTILTSHDPAAIRKILDSALESIAFARGVSNHMGSAATENARTMEIIFKELKRRNLYYLDSFVTSKSVCLALADRIGLAFAKRDIFLDNREDPEYIRGQLYKLKMKAKMYGFAIGIGHDRKTTLEVLRSAMPELAKEGYRFVFVSELVK